MTLNFHLLKKCKARSRLYTRQRKCLYLGTVTHFVLWFWEEIALSNSSRAPDFFNFFTNDLTAFSHHLSSSEPFFQPSRRFTTGGVNDGNIPFILWNANENASERPTCSDSPNGPTLSRKIKSTDENFYPNIFVVLRPPSSILPSLFQSRSASRSRVSNPVPDDGDWSIAIANARIPWYSDVWRLTWPDIDVKDIRVGLGQLIDSGRDSFSHVQFSLFQSFNWKRDKPHI